MQRLPHTPPSSDLPPAVPQHPGLFAVCSSQPPLRNTKFRLLLARNKSSRGQIRRLALCRCGCCRLWRGGGGVSLVPGVSRLQPDHPGLASCVSSATRGLRPGSPDRPRTSNRKRPLLNYPIVMDIDGTHPPLSARSSLTVGHFST